LKASFKLTVILLLFHLSFTVSGQKKADSLFKPHFYLYAGGFAPNVTTSIRFDSKTAKIGTILALEENLGFEDQPKLFRADATARTGKRSTFAFTYLSIKRNRDLTLDKNIQFMDTTFETGASGNLYFNTNYWALSYRYSIFAKQNWSAGLSLGVRILTVKSGLTATSMRLGTYSSNSELVVPAALIGIHGSAYLTPRFQFRYTWEYLKLNVEGINIYVFDNNLALEYFIIKNVGLGASYSNVAFLVRDVPFSDEFTGEIKYSWYGFSLFVAARF
jgi:hypothetical protein